MGFETPEQRHPLHIPTRVEEDASSITSLATAASPAQPPAVNGILPTPPAQLSKSSHLQQNDLRHRLDPRRPPNMSALSRPATHPPVLQPTPSATHTACLAPAAPHAVPRVKAMTVAASRRIRSMKQYARRQATATPPQSETQPPPPTAPLPQDSITQITDIVLSAIQARFPSQDCPAPPPAPAAHSSSSAADGPGVPRAAAPEPPPPPPAAVHGLGSFAAPGALGAGVQTIIF
jgi:hypothetical protein